MIKENQFEKMRCALEECRKCANVMHGQNDNAMIVCSMCHEIEDVVEEALSVKPRNCDVGKDWLKDFYCYFKPPKGMREMPPEWVDCVMSFCKWLVAPTGDKTDEQNSKT